MDINQLLSESNAKLGLIVTGGGSRIISNILCKGGASKFFQFAEVPYAREFVDASIGQSPSSKYCSVETARELAQAAYLKMTKCAELDGLVMGVGITATLGYEGQREGRVNEVHIAIYTKECVSVITYTLFGNRDHQEDSVVKNFEYFLEQFIKNNPFYKKFPNVIIPELDTAKDTLLVYSGSFNPYHEGHDFVANLAKSSFPNAEFVYEISTSIYEKQSLDGMEVDQRISNLPQGSKVVVSDIKFFEEKHHYLTSLYPHVKKFIFVMGWDTYERVITRVWTDAYLTDFNKFSPNSIVSVFVVPRPTYGNDLTNFKYKRSYVEPICLTFDADKMNIPNISSTELRKK
jgi:nicotinic acid mononucleotide adenylyltransferase/nicotinamide mononucleotide (NMN) deamidase PncC